MPRTCATASRSPTHERAGWWSSVELPGGYVAPRIDSPVHTLEALRLPDLTGKTVLHVGSGDGYFAFAAERLGASRVTVLDVPSLRRPGHRDSFEYAKAALASDVREVAMEISDIALANIGEFDVVLLLDTLHRLSDPLAALERVARVTRERLVVEVQIDTAISRSLAATLRELGFERTLAIPAAKRVTSKRLRGLPAQLRTGIDVLAMTPISARPAVRRELAKSLTRTRLVVHGVRERRR